MSSLPKKFLALLLVAGWLAAAAVGGPYFGRLPEVQSQSPTDFLPATAESTRALQLRALFDDDLGPPAVVVFVAEEAAGIDGPAAQALEDRMRAIDLIEGVGPRSPLLPSGERAVDGSPLALQAFVTVQGATAEVVAAMRAVLADPPAGVGSFVTGPAGFLADLVEAFGEIDGILLLVTVSAVLLILLVVYRSPLLPLLVLSSAIGALSVSVVVVFWMAKAGWISLNGQTQGILFILVVGAATDYGLLMVARFREALKTEQEVGAALRKAWRGALEPILASGGTVIAGLLCLLASDLNSNRALGPVAAVGIVWSMLAGLSFLPALLALVGRAAFFPFAPKVAVPADARVGITEEHGEEQPANGIWTRVASTVQRHPRRVWVVTTVGLLAAAAFFPTFRADGVAQSEVVLGATESAAGQAAQARYFAAGAGAPTVVLGDASRVDPLREALAAVDGVASVTVRSAGFGAAATPMVVEDQGRSWVELQVTLAYAADSDAAIGAVGELRSAVRSVDPDGLVGGPTAADLDTRRQARADLGIIIPLVLVVITAMLVLLLRSLLAPVLLVATTVLSYLATLGIASLLFDGWFGFPGADPVVPLFAFVFLVALGIDYNIFLTSRVREEALRVGTRPAVLLGLRVTGGVITSAGVVLAATFAALAVIPLLFLAQIAFLVAFGVLLDALVVRTFLVPGLLYDLGSKAWWPARLPMDDRS